MAAAAPSLGLPGGGGEGRGRAAAVRVCSRLGVGRTAAPEPVSLCNAALRSVTRCYAAP